MQFSFVFDIMAATQVSALPLSLCNAASKCAASCSHCIDTPSTDINVNDLLNALCKEMRESLMGHLVSSTTLLTQLNQYYAQKPSKHIRPRIVYLMSMATNAGGGM